MPRSGLSRERVVEAAAQWIDRHGASGFSMRALAESLNIKAASLYNHVESMDRLRIDVCAYALHQQYEAQQQAISALCRGDAIAALCHAYRGFVRQHRSLYWLIIKSAAMLHAASWIPSLPRWKIRRSTTVKRRTGSGYFEPCSMASWRRRMPASSRTCQPIRRKASAQPFAAISTL